MITRWAQRWKRQRGVYRPRGEPIRRSEYDVDVVPDDTTARAFIREHHYLRSYVAAVRRFSLARRGQLVGIAVFSMPVNPATLDPLHVDPKLLASEEAVGPVELGRLVLLPDVPANGESFFLGRCFELLRREGCTGVVSFSDPARRTAADGRVLSPGHVGTIYQATNFIYAGRTRPDHEWVVPSTGEVISRRTLAKIATMDVGSRCSAVARIEDLGAVPLGNQCPRRWLEVNLPRVAARVHRPGKHKYLLPLDSRLRLRPSLPYPKMADPMRPVLDLEQLFLFEPAVLYEVAA